MSTRPSLALLTCVVAALSAGSASAATKKPIYVSLGDSLAWSYTKTPTGAVAQSAKGYSEVVAAKARRMKRYGAGLTLKKFGCPGESTASYLSGEAATRVGGHDCGFSKSQHADSLAYVKKHRKRIGFITLNIGNNNFTPCAAGASVDIPCIQQGSAALDRDLPRIYRELRRAAGKRARIAVFNVYDPFLALYLQGAEYRELALLTVGVAREISTTIARFARRQRFRLADAFGAFKTSQVEQNATVEGQPVPVAVAQICAYTFMCQPPPAGPDIHPTDAGYAALATAAAKALKIR